ncbi:DUF4426 domain-containing protein [Marinospirillum perlucidum]|uniref:DUF4426 domain-containing protein n=1 Tax=Marinospirillum perlucidum TaxID=1982602 RepID=UPI00138FD416|nr:DUF4426 domain-containing protein [Marinospirillum perlucidum]
MLRKTQALVLMVVLAGLALPLWADSNRGVREAGDYRIYYDVLPTSFLDAQVAQGYGITRSRGFGLVRVTVRKQLASGASEPVRARVSGQVGNLVGQANGLAFRELEVGQDRGYSYVAVFRYREEDSLRFNLSVNFAGQPLESLDFVARLSGE